MLGGGGASRCLIGRWAEGPGRASGGSEIADCRNRSNRGCRNLAVPVGTCPDRNTTQSGDHLMMEQGY